MLDARLPDQESTDQEVDEPEDEEITDQSADSQVEVRPEDQSPLSETVRRSIIESARACFKFAGERLVSVAADHLVPVLGGRAADLAFEAWDLMASIRALDSDEPVLEMPLPLPVSGLDLSLEIRLANGEDGQTAPPLAICVGPDSPSLTGGWALDADEDGDPQTQPPADDTETEAALERLYTQREPVVRTIEPAQPEPRVTRSATACLVEIDLDSLPLPGQREIRAWSLALLAAEYAPELRKIPELGRFEVFIIAGKGRRCGLWVWRDTDSET